MNFDWLGSELHRPECVLCTSDGSVFVSDWRGGVCQIGPDGHQTAVLGVDPPCPIQPNGIALLPGRQFLLANLADSGGVWRLDSSGLVTPFVTEVEGEQLPATNFVMVDSQQRVWITVSTRQVPRALGYRSEVADGFIVRVDSRGAAVVADGLGYTNEVQIHPDGRWLYVNETFARRLSRFPLSSAGELGPRETLVEFGFGIFPDGMAFDEAGGLWIVSIVSNAVLHIDPDGTLRQVLQDASAEHLAWVEHAYYGSRMGPEHLQQVDSQQLRNVSSIAFTGEHRRTAVLGCLLGEQLATFTVPISGVEPVHWHW